MLKTTVFLKCLFDICIAYIGSNFSHFDRDPRLLKLPDSCKETLVNYVMKSTYKPHSESPAISAEEVDLTQATSSEKEKCNGYSKSLKKQLPHSL